MSYLGLVDGMKFPIKFKKPESPVSGTAGWDLECKLDMNFVIRSTDEMLKKVEDKSVKLWARKAWSNLIQIVERIAMRPEIKTDSVSANLLLNYCDAVDGFGEKTKRVEIGLSGDLLSTLFSEYNKVPLTVNLELHVSEPEVGPCIWREDIDSSPSITERGECAFNFVSPSKRMPFKIKEGTEYKGQVDIFLHITAPLTERSTSNDSDISLPAVQDMCANILSDQIECDFELVAENGKHFPCHKVFLAGSPVLGRMLQSQCEEVRKKAYLMSLSENGLQAFLNFIYAAEIDEAIQNSFRALELLEAAHKYDVAALEKAMIELFLKQSIEWMDTDVAVMLYLHALKVGANRQLMWKAIQVMKSKPDELVKSSPFDELLRTDLVTAKEIIRLAIKTGSAPNASARKK